MASWMPENLPVARFASTAGFESSAESSGKKQRGYTDSGVDMAGVTDPQLLILLSAIHQGNEATQRLTTEFSAHKADCHNRFDRLETTTTQLAARMTRLEQSDAASSVSGQADSSTGGTQRGSYGRVEGAPSLPFSQRKTIVVGGFGEEFEKAELEALAVPLFSKWQDQVTSVQAIGRIATLVKVEFASAKSMWKVLTEMKGKKFQVSIPSPAGTITRALWHSMDKPEEERAMDRRTTIGVKRLQEHLLKQVGSDFGDDAEEKVRRMILPDYRKCIVCVRLPDQRLKRIFERPRNAYAYKLSDNWQDSGLVNFDAADVVSEMNEL